MDIVSLEQLYDVRILAVTIKGKRWQFAGDLKPDMPIGIPLRIAVNAAAGFVVYNWDKLPQHGVNELEASLREFASHE